MTYEIIDNALSQEEFENIKNFMLNPGFPWNLTPVVTNQKENLPITASYYSTHEFWSGFHTEPQTHTEENRKKISDRHKGVPKSEEHKRKISEANKGKVNSEETRKKISEANKGKQSSFLGKTHTEETKKKISESKMGNTYSLGKKHTEEVKRKMSIAAKNRKTPSGDITLNVTGIPTSSDFDDHSITFAVIVNNTGTARTCTAVNLNGVSKTIR